MEKYFKQFELRSSQRSCGRYTNYQELNADFKSLTANLCIERLINDATINSRSSQHYDAKFVCKEKWDLPPVTFVTI
jgi:hypothetical protein